MEFPRKLRHPVNLVWTNWITLPAPSWVGHQDQGDLHCENICSVSYALHTHSHTHTQKEMQIHSLGLAIGNCFAECRNKGQDRER